MKFVPLSACWLLAALFATSATAQKKWKETWLSEKDPTAPPDLKFQGEYQGENLAAQVISLGDGAFQAVLYPGGLPGAGWDGKNRMLMDGKLDGERAVFNPTEGNRSYLAGNPKEFCATRPYPPPGHQPATGTIQGGAFKVSVKGGPAVTLKKTLRKSPTLGARPPPGARVLFDGSNKDAWKGGRVDDNGVLHTDAASIDTKDQFTFYKVHLEFMLCYKPKARGQGRSNSGFYQSDGYEVQVLDSFGLNGEGNECGAIYGKAGPKVNMCFPPLTWQTYDVTLAPGKNPGDKVLITVVHNGVTVHENVVGKSDKPRRHLHLQGHGNPLQYRNIWIQEIKAP